MGRSRKFDYQAAIENSLNARPDGLTLDEILERAGFEVDRSTLFRHLARLIAEGRAERIGNARASRYRPLGAGTRERVVPPPAQPAAQPPGQPSANKEAGNYRQVPAKPAGVPVLSPEHAAVVKKAVRTVVREWKRCNRVNLQIYLSLLAKAEHLDKLTAAVEKELAGLHEGNLTEFELTEAELRAYTPPAGRKAAGE